MLNEKDGVCSKCDANVPAFTGYVMSTYKGVEQEIVCESCNEDMQDNYNSLCDDVISVFDSD